MKPIEVLDLVEKNTYHYVDTYNGCNDSINRLDNKDCVIAHFTFDRLTYIVIQTTNKQMRLYRMINFDTNTYRHGKVTAEQVTKPSSIFKTLQLKFKVLDKELFEKFKKANIMDAVISELPNGQNNGITNI